MWFLQIQLISIFEVYVLDVLYVLKSLHSWCYIIDCKCREPLLFVGECVICPKIERPFLCLFNLAGW